MRHALLIVALLLSGLAGCADDPAAQGPSARERQDAALRDPFNYSPYKSEDKADISGGKLTEFKKDAFRKDVDSVLDP